ALDAIDLAPGDQQHERGHRVNAIRSRSTGLRVNVNRSNWKTLAMQPRDHRSDLLAGSTARRSGEFQDNRFGISGSNRHGQQTPSDDRHVRPPCLACKNDNAGADVFTKQLRRLRLWSRFSPRIGHRQTKADGMPPRGFLASTDGWSDGTNRSYTSH